MSESVLLVTVVFLVPPKARQQGQSGSPLVVLSARCLSIRAAFFNTHAVRRRSANH